MNLYCQLFYRKKPVSIEKFVLDSNLGVDGEHSLVGWLLLVQCQYCLNNNDLIITLKILCGYFQQTGSKESVTKSKTEIMVVKCKTEKTVEDGKKYGQIWTRKFPIFCHHFHPDVVLC